jgi:hypothetical protein
MGKSLSKTKTNRQPIPSFSNLPHLAFSVCPFFIFSFVSFTIFFTSSLAQNKGARLNIQLDEHILNPIGQTLPKDASKLVGLLFNSMPLELFDPNRLQMDVTYLDAELRIVRYTGGSGKLEGVRNIFVRV